MYQYFGRSPETWILHKLQTFISTSSKSQEYPQKRYFTTVQINFLRNSCFQRMVMKCDIIMKKNKYIIKKIYKDPEIVIRNSAVARFLVFRWLHSIFSAINFSILSLPWLWLYYEYLKIIVMLWNSLGFLQCSISLRQFSFPIGSRNANNFHKIIRCRDD